MFIEARGSDKANAMVSTDHFSVELSKKNSSSSRHELQVTQMQGKAYKGQHRTLGSFISWMNESCFFLPLLSSENGLYD